MDFLGRARKLEQALAASRLDAFLVTHLANVRYLCGFTGSSGVLAVAGGRRAFFTDGRYTTQAREEVVGARVVVTKHPALVEAMAWLRKQRARRLGFDALIKRPRQRPTTGGPRHSADAA